MKIDKTYAVYFSPTGTSQKSAVSIARGIEGTLEEIDITNLPIESRAFSRQNLVVFGVPVYGGRIPKEAIWRLKKFAGDHTPCVITVTYGNRDFDDSLLELFNLVNKQGFIPIAAAALVGQHTYGEIQVGRPDHQDEYQDGLFGSLVRLKMNKDDLTFVSVPGHYPYRPGGNAGKFRPLTNDKCNHCGLCVKKCPVQAIDKDDCCTIADNCLSCFRCIRICPNQAKNMDEPNYQAFADEFSKKLSQRKENEYFV